MWFISDTHYGHKNFLTFRDKNNNLIRPFSSVEEMDEHMVEQHNKHVKPNDKVYHLGDVCFGNPTIVSRLNGSKRLVVGNHDNLKDNVLMGSFKKVTLWRIFKEFNFSLSHIPMREDSFQEKVQFNLHGHIHQNQSPTMYHINLCVEHTNYRPLHLDEILAIIAKK